MPQRFYVALKAKWGPIQYWQGETNKVAKSVFCLSEVKNLCFKTSSKFVRALKANMWVPFSMYNFQLKCGNIVSQRKIQRKH